MNKFKLFVENFLVYGFGGIISKLIPLIMVPVVTRLMPDSSYYGISDLSNTVVQFGSALAVMGMYDAMYRMFFEKDTEEYKKTICSTALIFTIATSICVFGLMLLFRDLIATFVFKDKNFAYVVYLSALATLVGATNSIISAPARMQNKRKIYLLANTISPVLSYAIAVPLLLNGYYIIALPLAAVISGVTMELAFGILNRGWFDIKLFDVSLCKKMLVIAIPLLPNFLFYWLLNSCDKLMIANMLDVGDVGIYSVGSKLGHASQLIYTAFAGGWQFFAFSTMKEENQAKSNSLIFEYLGVISYMATAFVCAFSYPIYKILFTSEYLEGYIVAPYLFFAPLLQMLFQVAANQFLVIKNTWPNMFILLIGAFVNVIFNYNLIPVLGIEGAAISTLIGYIVADIICVIVLSRMKLMMLERKFVLSSVLIIGYIVLWRIFMGERLILSIAGVAALTAIYFMMYKKEISRLFIVGSKR